MCTLTIMSETGPVSLAITLMASLLTVFTAKTATLLAVDASARRRLTAQHVTQITILCRIQAV